MPYTFSLPGTGDLSTDQRFALKTEPKDVFIISGCPGSGKTTVALLRSKGKGSNSKFHYTVWANMLYGYLLNVSNQLEVSESHFSTFWSWFYRNFKYIDFNNPSRIAQTLHGARVMFDELQLDEGQDIDIEIRTALASISKKMIICMDPAQDVNGTCNQHEDEIQKSIRYLESQGKSPKHIRLDVNWRNTQQIFAFSKSIIPEINSSIQISRFVKQGDKPKLFKLDGQNKIFEKVVELINEEGGRNIGILSDSPTELKSLQNHLSNKNISSSRYCTQEHRRRNSTEKRKFLTSMENVILSTFISCKGLEFDIVIFLDISNFSDDFKKKKGYYVGATRALTKLIMFKDTSNYSLPSWFNRIDNSLYDEIGSSNSFDENPIF